MDLGELRRLAESVKREFEEKKLPLELIKELYEKYTFVPDIDSFFDEAMEIFPKLNCGAASVYLKYKIKRFRIINGKYGDKDHTFLITENNFVVDITSDQYGGPRVYGGNLKYPWSM